MTRSAGHKLVISAFISSLQVLPFDAANKLESFLSPVIASVIGGCWASFSLIKRMPVLLYHQCGEPCTEF
ncbi:hypothetical protein QQF64_035268 [Cirrhinus molitorella]|uniref:Uncharacterized protein n=1 Tax=Cirrhinus molitorella TaxID=172907 RepID=A0ABR3NFB1_9TELE